MRARFLRHLQRRWRHGAFRRPRLPRSAAPRGTVLWLVAALGLLLGVGLQLSLNAESLWSDGLPLGGGAGLRPDLDKMRQAIPETVANVTGHPSWEEAAVQTALPRDFRSSDGSAPSSSESPWRRMLQLGLAIMLGYDPSTDDGAVVMSLPRFDDGTRFDDVISASEGSQRRMPPEPPRPSPPVEQRPPAPEGPEPDGEAESTAEGDGIDKERVDEDPGDGEEARAALAGRTTPPTPDRSPGGVADLDRVVRPSGDELATPFLSPSGTCRVLIFHTHTSETYRTGDEPGEDHVWNTVETGIVQVGRALARILEDVYAVPTCHATTIHDWPSHARAYIEARDTVTAYLQRYPQIELVVDLHRDAPPELVTTVAGRSLARVAAVVGTHPTMHPDSATNVALARHIERLFENKYPGVFRQVIERSDARFNQDLHPRMVLLEVGSYDTHLDTALATANVLAEVLADVVYGIRTETLAGVGPPR